MNYEACGTCAGCATDAAVKRALEDVNAMFFPRMRHLWGAIDSAQRRERHRPLREQVATNGAYRELRMVQEQHWQWTDRVVRMLHPFGCLSPRVWVSACEMKRHQTAPPDSTG